MIEQKSVDHLFRHHYGRMVSILTRIFGLSQLEMIEDAVQDTFVKALLVWRKEMPDNPEAWLVKASKNRVIDLLRKAKADKNRVGHLQSGPSAIRMSELFLTHEIEDSQLRMIFTACHPILAPQDQISFALKTISGFGTKEIAAALLLKEETVKKRLFRARKTIATKNIAFQIPNFRSFPERMNRVLEVIYLTFNEGFHSNNKKLIIRQDLCGEAIRLVQLLLKKDATRTPDTYALFALMCFHSARLESRVGANGEIVDLKNQNRSLWYRPLIELGNMAMNKAVEVESFSPFHYEAAIAVEHLKAPSFDATDWTKILYWYQELYNIQPSTFTLLNQSIVLIQQEKYDNATRKLEAIDVDRLEQQKYLYYSTLAELSFKTNHVNHAVQYLDQAIDLVDSQALRIYLQKKRDNYMSNK